MKLITIAILILTTSLFSNDLKITSDKFSGDQKNGISIFTGHVNMLNGNDELNASKVIIYTDSKNQPTKMIGKSNVSFRIKTQKGFSYVGKAQKIVYFPKKKEYQFFNSVYIKQENSSKEIIGERVKINTVEGTAYAEGRDSEPVVMVFKLPSKDEEK